MKPYKIRYITIVLALLCMQVAWAQVLVPSLPEIDGPHASNLYSVQVRPLAGGECQEVPVLRCDVNTRRVQQAAYAEWDMGEPVVVRVMCKDGQQTEMERVSHPAILNNDNLLGTKCQ